MSIKIDQILLGKYVNVIRKLDGVRTTRDAGNWSWTYNEVTIDMQYHQMKLKGGYIKTINPLSVDVDYTAMTWVCCGFRTPRGFIWELRRKYADATISTSYVTANFDSKIIKIVNNESAYEIFVQKVAGITIDVLAGTLDNTIAAYWRITGANKTVIVRDTATTTDSSTAIVGFQNYEPYDFSVPGEVELQMEFLGEVTTVYVEKTVPPEKTFVELYFKRSILGTIGFLWDISNLTFKGVWSLTWVFRAYTYVHFRDPVYRPTLEVTRFPDLPPYISDAGVTSGTWQKGPDIEEVTWIYDSESFAIKTKGFMARTDYTNVYEGTMYDKIRRLEMQGLETIYAQHINALVAFTNYQQQGTTTSIAIYHLIPSAITTADTYNPATKTWTAQALTAAAYNYFDGESALHAVHSDFTLFYEMKILTEAGFKITAYGQQRFSVQCNIQSFVAGQKVGFRARMLKRKALTRPEVCLNPKKVVETEIIPDW